MLFQHFTQPQLEKLKSQITKFHTLNTDITNYSHILSNFSYYNSLFSKFIIQLFEYFSGLIDSKFSITLFIHRMNEHLNSIIESINKILSHSVKYISYLIRIIVFYFNIYLYLFYNLIIKQYENVLNKIKSFVENFHKETINIIYENRSMVYKIIRLIDNNIDIINRINSKKNEFSSYDTDTKLIKHSIEFDHNDITHFKTIVETHRTYKSSLDSYKSYINGLKKLKRFLEVYKYYVHYYHNVLHRFTITKEYIKDVNSIRLAMIALKLFILNHMYKYTSFIPKLEKIGQHINTMKDELKQVQNKIEDRAKEYMEGLKAITITQSEVKNDIKKIKEGNNLIIASLKIAKHTMEFYQTLESEIGKLKDVNFTNYDIPEFLKNSQQIQEKLKHFQNQIRNKLTFKSQISNAINKIKQQPNITTTNTNDIDSDIYNETHYNKIISPIQTLISTTLKEISVIKYIIYDLQIIKLNSMYLNSIKINMNKITDLDTALIKLSEILDELKSFYGIHINSMNMVVVFSLISFASYFINKYVETLRIVKYDIEILIFTIKSYIIILTVIQYVQNKLNEIKQKIPDLISKPQEIKILSTHTLNIKKYLESINSSIKSLEQVNTRLDINNLKDNISLVKYHVNQIYQNVIGVYINLNEIIKIKFKITELYNQNIEIQKTINETMIKIDSFINYLHAHKVIVLYQATKIVSVEKKLVFIIHLDCLFKLTKNLESIINYLKNVDLVIDRMGIKELINIIESKTDNTEKLVDKIESNVDRIENSIIDLECAIEGVARNFIQCSLLSSINNTTDTEINDNNINNNGKFNRDNDNNKRVQLIINILNV